MKTLLFPGTGMPVTIKTLQWLQNNTLNLVDALAREKEWYTVLWGMEYDPTHNEISDGAFLWQGQVIPFTRSEKEDTITIIETVENALFNTNPDNISDLASLPMYKSLQATSGVGGVHTFDTTLLKYYIEERVIARGVVDDSEIAFGDVPAPGAIVNVVLPFTVTGAYRIEYTLRTQGTVSTVATHDHMIIDSTQSSFRVAIAGAKMANREYYIEWKIVK